MKIDHNFAEDDMQNKICRRWSTEYFDGEQKWFKKKSSFLCYWKDNLRVVLYSILGM